jgi:hypothetical protein
VTGSLNGDVTIWPAGGGARIALLSGHTQEITALAFNADASRLATGSQDETLRIWDPSRAMLMAVLRGSSEPVSGVTFSSSGELLTSVDSEGAVQLRHAESVSEVQAKDLLAMLWTSGRLADDVIGLVRRNSRLPADVAEHAIRYAQALGDDPEMLNAESWKVVLSASAKPAAYAYALRQANSAARMRPWTVRYLTTLGAAQYRTGSYQPAIDTLTGAIKTSAAAFQDAGVPVRGQICAEAFLVMSRYRLGQTQEAREGLAQLRERTTGGNADLAGCVAEATALVGTRPNR